MAEAAGADEAAVAEAEAAARAALTVGAGAGGGRARPRRRRSGRSRSCTYTRASFAVARSRAGTVRPDNPPSHQAAVHPTILPPSIRKPSTQHVINFQPQTPEFPDGDLEAISALRVLDLYSGRLAGPDAHAHARPAGPQAARGGGEVRGR